MPSPRLSLATARRTFARLTPAAFAAAALALTSAAPAHAALFKITQCHDEVTTPDDVVDGFFKPLGLVATNHCAAGSLELALPGHVISPPGSPGQAVGYQWVIPATMPNTTFSSAWANLTVGAKTGGNARLGNATADGVPIGPSTLDIPAGDWAGIVGWGWEADAPAAGTRTISTAIECGSSCQFAADPVMSIYRATLELSESTLPLIPQVATTGLLDGTPQRGTRTLQVTAGDADSGVSKIEVHAPDGSVLATATEACRFDRPTPCPQTTPAEQLAVDTTQLADGPQSLAVWVYDAASNVRKMPLAAITVANATPAAATVIPNGSGGDRGSAVVSVTAKQAKVSLKAGHKVAITGHVVDGAGHPIVGAQVDVLEALALPGAATAKVGTVVTDASGAWSFTPTTTGSRTLTFAYAPGLGSTAYSARATSMLRVTTAITLKLSAGSIARRGRVTFSGKVGVAPLPAKGAQVQIQVRAPGAKRWRGAAVVRTRKGGVFTWTHQFVDRASWTFRARVLDSGDLNAVPGHSATASLRVR